MIYRILLTLHFTEHVVAQPKPSATDPETVLLTENNDADIVHNDPESDIIEIVRQEKQNSNGLDIDDDVSPEFANDPLFKLLKELNSSMEAGGDIPTNFDPASLFSSMPGMGNLPAGGAGATQAPQQPAPTKSRTTLAIDLTWTLIHFISNFVLAFYLGLHKSHEIEFKDNGEVEATAIGDVPSSARLLWYFATLQLILQSSQFFLETRVPPPPSKIVSLASFLPQPFSGYIINGVRYVRIIQTISQDFCLLLFIAGVASYFN